MSEKKKFIQLAESSSGIAGYRKSMGLSPTEVKRHMKMIGAHKKYIEAYDRLVELSYMKRQATTVESKRIISKEIEELRSQIRDVYKEALDAKKKEI